MDNGIITIAGGVLGVLSGFAIIILKPDQYEVGLGFITAGLLAVGVRRAVTKAVNSLSK